MKTLDLLSDAMVDEKRRSMAQLATGIAANFRMSNYYRRISNPELLAPYGGHQRNLSAIEKLGRLAQIAAYNTNPLAVFYFGFLLLWLTQYYFGSRPLRQTISIASISNVNPWECQIELTEPMRSLQFNYDL